jgi:hypothetical protein
VINFKPSDATRETIRGMGFGDQQFNKEYTKFLPYYMGRGTIADDWDAMLVSWFQRTIPEAAPPPSASGVAMINRVFVVVESLGWKSWVTHIKETKGITWSRTIERTDDAGHVQHGWWWPAEYAPGYDEATGERIAPQSEDAA